MAYLGNAPARSFISFERQVFTIVNSQTAYALSHSVTNENDIRLVVNNVVQEPGSGKAYTATGTALTLSAALTNGTDEMYCVFLGRATATSAPGAGSIGTTQLAADAVTNAKIADDAISDEQLDPTVITGQTAEATIATDDLILLSDTSASGALRKMTRANFVAGVGGTMTPTFRAYRNSSLNVDSNSSTKIVFDAETFDPQSTFASGTFTPGVSGKYFLSSSVRLAAATYNQIGLIIYKNGSGIAYQWHNVDSGSGNPSGTVSTIVESDTDDYFEIYLYHLKGSAAEVTTGTANTWFNGFKIVE